MAYIGKTPASAALTSSDISDGIISTAKIADANVTNPKLTSGSQQNFRNIIINGDMSIAQRATSVTGITNGSGGYHTVDRFAFAESGSPSAIFTQSQSTDVPTGQGFAKSLKMDCTTAQGSLGAGDILTIRTTFEGQNVQYLKKGTSSAESTTLSFWVKSAKTGTYICELLDKDNTRSISKSYTISSANTWEKKTLTYDGDTTGTLNNDNGSSLQCKWWLAAGSGYSSGTLQTSWGSTTTANTAVGQVNFADSTSNDWYITGVQLEAGTSASDFEFLPVDVNLRRCMRYFESLIMSEICAVGYTNSTSNAITVMTSSVIKRTSPSLTLPAIGSSSGKISFLNAAGGYPSTFGSMATFDTNITSFSVNQTGMTSAYSGVGLAVALYNGDGVAIKIDAEL